MKLSIHSSGVTLWLSARDTYAWATRPSKRWPCSDLSGHRLLASFDRNGLCDMSINGGRGSQEVSSSELTAICADYLRDRLPKDHPCYFVAVGQFETEGAK